MAAIPTPSEQAKSFAQKALEELQKLPTEKHGAPTGEPAQLPAAERKRLLALAYDAMLKLEAQTPKAVAGDQITAEAFWWGWHLSVPHSQVEPLLENTEIITSIVEVALNVIPEVGELIALGLKGYVLIYKGLILAVDQGNGVYLSQTWLNTPGVIFIPTTR